jgi:hypothetical protein
VRCSLPVITPESTLFPKTEQQFQQLRQHNREVGQSCLDEAGELVRHMGSVSVVRDHEALRMALGEGKINWLGVSYGTQLAPTTPSCTHRIPGQWFSTPHSSTACLRCIK